MPGELGIISEIGAGKGKGFNICYPVPLEADDSYLEGYCNFLEPYLKKFQPEIIIVAMGLDGHWADPIGNLSFSSNGYTAFAKWIHKIANTVCDGKLAFILEGGYNLAVLPHLAEIFLCEFTTNTKVSPFEDHILPFLKTHKTSNEEIKKYKKLLKTVLDPYWN